MLRMASVDRERENFQSSQNSVKITWLWRAHRKISNGTNDLWNRVTVWKICAVEVLIKHGHSIGGYINICTTDIKMPHGSTIGYHVSSTNGIFKGPCGPIEKCHVAPPRDAMWHHPINSTCLVWIDKTRTLVKKWNNQHAPRGQINGRHMASMKPLIKNH
jgi:hypothetical protein